MTDTEPDSRREAGTDHQVCRGSGVSDEGSVRQEHQGQEPAESQQSAIGSHQPGVPNARLGQRLDGWLHNHLTSVVLVVVGLGLVLRVIVAALTFIGPGEVLNFLSARQLLAANVYRGGFDIPQPLYCLFLRGWQLLGTGDFMLRLPSVLAGTAAVWVAFLWLRRALDNAAALVGVTLLTFAPVMIRESALVNGSAMLVLAVVGTLYLLERALADNSIQWMIAFAVALVLTVTIGMPGLWFAFGLGLYVATCMPRREFPSLAGHAVWVSAQFLAFAAGAALYAPLAFGLGHGVRTRAGWAGWPGTALFQPGQDNVAAFVARNTVAVFQYLVSSRTDGTIVLLLFLAAVVLVLVGRFRPDNASARGRRFGLLMLFPFPVACLAAIAGVTGYGHDAAVLFLFVFAAAAVGLLWARVAGRPLWLVLLAAVAVVPAWNTGSSGIEGTLRGQRRSSMDQAIAYVRDAVPLSGLVFADRQTQILLHHYLSRGTAAPHVSETGEFVEVLSGDYRLLSPLYAQPVPTDSLDWHLARLSSAYGLASGDEVCVASVGETGNLASELERNVGAVYPGLRSFGPRIAVFFVPVVGNALGMLAEDAASVARRQPRTVFWPTARFDDSSRHLLGPLAARVMSYRELYSAVAESGEYVLHDRMPALAFWVFGSAENHPRFMRYMDDKENYISGNCRFTLLAADPDSVAGLYLVESPIGDALDSLTIAGTRSLNKKLLTAFWPTAYLTTSARRRASSLAARVFSYAELYRRLREREGLDRYLPALAFWTFGTTEGHPAFMRYMDDCENYTSGGYRFTLLAADRDSLAGVYLVEPQAGDALDSLALAAAKSTTTRYRAVLWPSEHFTDSTAVRTRRLSSRVSPYSELYEYLQVGEFNLDDYLPALAFWVYDTGERHPAFMAYMNDGENYVFGQYSFTLLLDDPEKGVAAYAIELRPSEEAPPPR